MPGQDLCQVGIFLPRMLQERDLESHRSSQSSTHFLSCFFMHTHVGQKGSAFCGAHISLWPFYRSEPPRSAQVMRFPGAWREEILSIVQATSSSASAQEEVDTLVLYSDEPET